MYATLEESQESRIKLESSWKNKLIHEFSKPYMIDLRKFLSDEIKKNKVIFPKPSDIFNAFKLSPFEKVNVVIIGQDPYHGPGQAHGLCFSVKKGVPPPPSLINIFKELESDLGIPRPSHGCLESWANQGVLLLNSVLTVESGKAGAHAGRGWEIFTDKVIESLNESIKPIVFMLWGSYALKKGAVLDRKKHLVLESVHPSPLSAHRGFLGCKHFSKANKFLEKNSMNPINWNLA